MSTFSRARHIGNFAIEFVVYVDHINPWDRIPRSQNIPKSLAYIGMESYWWEKCTWLSPKKPHYLILSWYLESISTWKKIQTFSFALGPKIQSNHGHSYLLSIFPTTRVACLGLRVCIQNKSRNLARVFVASSTEGGSISRRHDNTLNPLQPKVFLQHQNDYQKASLI